MFLAHSSSYYRRRCSERNFESNGTWAYSSKNKIPGLYCLEFSVVHPHCNSQVKKTKLIILVPIFSAALSVFAIKYSGQKQNLQAHKYAYNGALWMQACTDTYTDIAHRQPLNIIRQPRIHTIKLTRRYYECKYEPVLPHKKSNNDCNIQYCTFKYIQSVKVFFNYLGYFIVAYFILELFTPLQPAAELNLEPSPVKHHQAPVSCLSVIQHNLNYFQFNIIAVYFDK